jgi:hypothetical protein
VTFGTRAIRSKRPFLLTLGLVAGGGFEPHLAIDNTQVIGFTGARAARHPRESKATVHPQYVLLVLGHLAQPLLCNVSGDAQYRLIPTAGDVVNTQPVGKDAGDGL